PDRNNRRVTTTSGEFGLSLSVFQIRLTCAIPSGLRFLDPLKITSSILSLRRVFADCSPNTQFRASTMLRLPHPLGPTIPVIPSGILIRVFSQKDLKPRISILSNHIIEHYIPWWFSLAPQSIAEKIGKSQTN